MSNDHSVDLLNVKDLCHSVSFTACRVFVSKYGYMSIKPDSGDDELPTKPFSLSPPKYQSTFDQLLSAQTDVKSFPFHASKRLVLIQVTLTEYCTVGCFSTE